MKYLLNFFHDPRKRNLKKPLNFFKINEFKEFFLISSIKLDGKESP